MTDAIEGRARLISSSSVIRPPVTEVCGNCHFGRDFRDGLRLVPNMRECFGSPPTPIVVGMSPQGPAIAMTRVRLKIEEPGCALWRLKLAT